MTEREQPIFSRLSPDSLGYPALIGSKEQPIRLEELPTEYLVQIARGMMLVRREQLDDELTRYFFRWIRNWAAELCKKHPSYFEALNGLEQSWLLLAAVDQGARDVLVDRLIGVAPQEDLLIHLIGDDWRPVVERLLELRDASSRGDMPAGS